MALQAIPWRGAINTDASLFQNLVAQYDFNANTSDLSGQGNNAIPQGPLTLTAGHKGAANSAYAFDGTSAYLSTTNQITNPQNYSMNVWFQITGTSGGNLVGFCNTQVTAPSNYDRILWVDTAGRVSWGVYTGSVFYITSTGTYNDGNWHMATATMSTTSGMALYVDGSLAASNANTVSQSYSGWWRVGQNNTAGGWPTPAGTLFPGTMDDIKIYSVTLSATQVAELYTI